METFMTSSEAAARLGISRSTLYRRVASRAIPAVRVGRLRRFRSADIEHAVGRAAKVHATRTEVWR